MAKGIILFVFWSYQGLNAISPNGILTKWENASRAIILLWQRIINECFRWRFSFKRKNPPKSLLCSRSFPRSFDFDINDLDFFKNISPIQHHYSLYNNFAIFQGDEIVAESDRVKIVLKEEPNQVYYAALEIKVRIVVVSICSDVPVWW